MLGEFGFPFDEPPGGGVGGFGSREAVGGGGGGCVGEVEGGRFSVVSLGVFAREDLSRDGKNAFDVWVVGGVRLRGSGDVDEVGGFGAD